jgi:uncharacterized damage-inducible protein DinB
MMNHWQQIEQVAKDNIARVQRERSEAVRSQQSISRYFKAVIRAVRHFVSEEKKALERVAVSEWSTRPEDWQRIRCKALASITLYP